MKNVSERVEWSSVTRGGGQKELKGENVKAKQQPLWWAERDEKNQDTAGARSGQSCAAKGAKF